MSRSRMFVISLVAVAAFAAVPSAIAFFHQPQAFRYVDTSCCVLKGSRTTIWSPATTEVSIGADEWFITSAYADSRVNDLIQTGIEYEYSQPGDPSCNLGANQRTLYYFVEVASNGVYFCYSRGYANFDEAHLHSVVRNADGYWRAYRDGNFQNVRTKWGTDCSGDACLVAALGEKNDTSAGRWPAKFAGGGHTPWQRWTGTSWVTVQASFSETQENWTGPSGPFPGGIWNFLYSE